MLKHNQDGSVGGLSFFFGLTVLLLIAALVFGVWAFNGRQDYKNNVDAKINAAVIVAKQQEDIVQAAQYAAAAKLPLRTYDGPEAYGSLVINYPKTWSAYVDDSGTGSAVVDGYFDPGTVPSLTAQTSVFALRVQVLNVAYAQAVSSFSGQASSPQTVPTTITAYSLPKVPQVVGVKVTGTLQSNSSTPLTGTMVILPLRSETLEISTQGSQYLSDFNTSILPNFSFSP